MAIFGWHGGHVSYGAHVSSELQTCNLVPSWWLGSGRCQNMLWRIAFRRIQYWMINNLYSTIKKYNITYVIYNVIHIQCHISYICMVVSKISSLLETAILSQKKFYFSQTFRHIHKKLSRGPMLDCIWEFFVRKQKLDKGHLLCLSDLQNSFCGGCAFTWRVLLLTVVLAHLLGPVLTLPHRN